MIFYFHTPFTRNLTNNVTDWSTVCRSKTCKVPQVPCELKAEPCKFFSFQKFGLTRVNWVRDNNFCTNKLYRWSKITSFKKYLIMFFCNLPSIIFLPWRSPTCFNTELGKWGRTFKFQPILKKKERKRDVLGITDAFTKRAFPIDVLLTSNTYLLCQLENNCVPDLYPVFLGEQRRRFHGRWQPSRILSVVNKKEKR